MGSLHRLFLSTDAIMSTYDFHICFNSEGSQYAIENSHEDGLVLVVVVPAELQARVPLIMEVTWPTKVTLILS